MRQRGKSPRGKAGKRRACCVGEAPNLGSSPVKHCLGPYQRAVAVVNASRAGRCAMLLVMVAWILHAYAVIRVRGTMNGNTSFILGSR